MSVDLSGYSLDQLQKILDKAPKFAKYYMHDKNLHGDIGFYSEKFVVEHHNKATSFKLEDIKAVIASRLKNRNIEDVKNLKIFIDSQDEYERVTEILLKLGVLKGYDAYENIKVITVRKKFHCYDTLNLSIDDLSEITISELEELKHRKKDVEVFVDALDKQGFVELPDFSNSIIDRLYEILKDIDLLAEFSNSKYDLADNFKRSIKDQFPELKEVAGDEWN